MTDLIILHITVPLEHFVEFVFDFGLCVLQTVGAGSVGNGLQLAFHRDVSVFIRQKSTFHGAFIDPYGVSADLLVRNGLQA